MRGEFINEYQKLNSEDQKAFRRWLWAKSPGVRLTTPASHVRARFGRRRRRLNLR